MDLDIKTPIAQQDDRGNSDILLLPGNNIGSAGLKRDSPVPPDMLRTG
jgi:hypothetical protein